MFGYVVIDKPNILIKDFQTYRSYYCGLCKAIGKRYGTAMRFTLNYDIVLLALLGHNYEDVCPEFREEHCITHPIGKVPSVKNNAVLEKIADVNIILGYYKAVDDLLDEKHRVWKTLLHPAFKKAAKRLPAFAQTVQNGYNRLREGEKKKRTPSFLAEIFGQMLMQTAEIITSRADSALKQLLFYTGKWVYLIDATDDVKKDTEKGNFNPFLSVKEWKKDYFDEVEQKARPLLYDCIDRIIENYEKMSITVSDGALGNIIYRGFESRTEQILSAKGEKCKKIRL